MASELIIRSLYGGKVNIVHNPNARGRAPRYLVNNTEKPKGVTTILGQTLAKDLMQWAVDCMGQYLTEKLPRITGDDLKEGAKEYTRRRDGGASAGTEAHYMVEQFLKGEKSDGRSISPEAMKAVNAYKAWHEKVQPKIINVEEVIYSMEHQYAGTYDGMMEIGGRVYLTDLKTTNASRKAPHGVYAENFIQLGAYAGAHEEQRLFEEANGGTTLPKIDGLAVISAKKDGKLHFVTNEDLGLPLDLCSQLFIEVVNIHRFLNSATKALGGK